MTQTKRDTQGINRRQFVVMAGTGVAGGLIGCAVSPAKQEAGVQPLPGVVPQYIAVNQDLCSGCRICEQVCSEFHYGVFNPTFTAITVNRSYGGSGHWIKTETCRQCPNPWCMRVCPVDAISRDRKTGAVVVDEKKCIDCGDCYTACPFGMIQRQPERKKAFKCDLCGGDPQCVARCPMSALSLKPQIWKQHEFGGVDNA